MDVNEIRDAKSWKVGVKTASDKNWVYNSLRFFTRDQAQYYADQIFVRWTAVTETTVQPTQDLPNQDRRRAVRIKGNPFTPRS